VFFPHEAEAAPTVVAPPAGRTLASQPLGIELDRDRQRVYQHGRWVRLTPREFRLAACLFERRDKVVSHVELLKAMGKGYQEIDVKVLHTVVARVKEAFGWKDKRVIQNVHGVGYLFDSEAGG
jgi:DNA-binding response OmpR family regulator